MKGWFYIVLNEIMFEVFDKVLDKNLFRVDCFLSKVKGRRMLTITTRNKLSYKSFIQKTKNIILENDIASHDDFVFDVDLTDELVNRVMKYTTVICINEFKELAVVINP